MATGGTIPTNRTQTVTFFNTTGIVDRDKNIYFAPRFSKYAQMSSGKDVRSAYLGIFKTVCPPSSAYADIQISGWSPQDRTLKVRGNIDDFRLVTEEGECLNYFILSRTITKENVDKTYYYGFFITGVQQAGGGSVLLTVEPDDFTNVFYLHNQHALTAGDIQNDYEPYNEKIKNAYVNRQHYNRVKLENRTVSDTTEPVDVSVEGSIIGGRVDISYQLPQGSEIDLDSIYYTADIENIPAGVTLSYSYVNAIRITFNNLGVGQTASLRGMVLHFNLVYHDVIEPDNMHVFLNQEETFRFKYQYRDMKYPISIYDGNFTEEEKRIIEETNMLTSLPEELRHKVILSCLVYLVIETKSSEIAHAYRYKGNSSVVDYKANVGELIEDNINRTNPVIVFPTFIIPLQFEKYSLQLKQVQMHYRVSLPYNLTYDIRHGDYSGNYISQTIDFINHNAIADYIYSAYIVKDVLIPKDKILFEQITGTYYEKLIFLCQFPSNVGGVNELRITERGLFLSGITKEIVSQYTDNNTFLIEQTQPSQFNVMPNTNFISYGLIVSDYKNNSFDIKIRESIPDLTNNYYDNVLEQEPYSFYSLSYLSAYELPFNKNRYYEGIESTINVLHYISFNGCIKEGFIPNYKVEDYQSKYFNEGLTITTSASLSLSSDSYSSYYYQNKAQMKNQYAVAEYQWGSDFAQKIFVSSPNQVGLRASKAGGWGALAETGNQVMGWVDDAIDYAQNKHVIEMNQKAKLADMGAKPDSLKQAGSDLIYELKTKEYNVYLNHYTIDRLSYNSIAKLFERTGYQVNLYTTLNTMDRVGWNFIKLNACDVVGNITLAQESTIRKIFTEGVTLLHDKSYLTSGHNFETILEGGE